MTRAFSPPVADCERGTPPEGASAQRLTVMFAAALTAASAFGVPTLAQDASTTLIVAGPRTPESLDQEYPPTEAVMELRRNINEPLLMFGSMTGEDGVKYEDFSVIEGALAESWEMNDDLSSITFTLRDGVLSAAGNPLDADDVMWTWERGWALQANFHWYMSQVLGIDTFDGAFEKVDDMTVRVNLPGSNPLLEMIWTNIGLAILDSELITENTTDDDPWGTEFLAANAGSFGAYDVTSYVPGQEIVYEANPNYYRGVAALEKVYFREMPTSSNRVAALQAGAVDVAEFLSPRELARVAEAPGVKVWQVPGNYIHRIEMNIEMEPFDDPRVRRALNMLVPREDILQAVYFGTASATKSPISDTYPGFTDAYFDFEHDVAAAKALLAEADVEEGTVIELGYRTGEAIEEEIAVILKSAFAEAGIDLQLSKLPASTLVERYSNGDIQTWFYRDMAIVPDAAYAANLWVHSDSVTNYANYEDAEVDALITASLASTDEAERLAAAEVVQEKFVEAAPWLFLVNPGYQLATRENVKGFSWYTPNSNYWYDFYKE